MLNPIKESELKQAKGKPVMVISNSEIFDLTRYSLERALQTTGKDTLAIVMENSDEGAGTIAEITQQFRATNETRKQLIKMSTLVLEEGQEPRHMVIYWSLDLMTIFDIGNWTYARMEKESEPEKRIQPHIGETIFLEKLSRLPSLEGNTNDLYRIYKPSES